MSDASEHLAPVSYLPWATPVERRCRSRRRRVPTAGRRRSSDPTERSRSATSEPRRRGSRRARGRSRFGDPSDASRRAERRRARFAIVADDPDETGPERDARIDRLVVSRLRRSALSVAEVRSVLAEHGLDEGEIEEWIERYERFGYLDDARLAEQLVHVNGARRGRGSGAILQELARRGVDADRSPRRRRRTRPRGRARATPSRSPSGACDSCPGSTGRPPSAGSPRSSSGAAIRATSVREAVTAALSADGS